MITALISEFSQKLLVANASWLSEIRAIGYLNRESILNARDKLVVTDGKDEIGITDTSGNSGHIRFVEGQNFTSQELQSTTSCDTAWRYTFRLRLVVVAKTETPEDLALLLATQVNAMTLSGGAKARTTGGGMNSAQIVLQEGGTQWNNNYRAVAIDFNLIFDYRGNCAIPITMTCPECESFVDIGCLPACGPITIQPSTYTGTMTLAAVFNGNLIQIGFEVTEGEPIQVPTNGLNSDYEYQIRLFDEDGNHVPVQLGPSDEPKDCIKVKLLP